MTLDGYQQVDERLREFYGRQPYGRVGTELLSPADQEDFYVVKATIWRGDEVGSTPPASTGLAHDSVANLPPHMKASALETCETSAIGRALANLGFSPKGQRPSREEMESKVSPVPHASPATDSSATAENEPQRGSTGASPVPDPEPTVGNLDSLGVSGAGATSAGGPTSDANLPSLAPAATSEGVSGSTEYGEGSGAAPPSDAPFARVVEVTGSRAEARKAINRVCDLEYTAKTVVETTDEEAEITIAALKEGALPRGSK